MNQLKTAAINIKRLTWLVLGLCFVLLYSCPVKKYLLLTYGKARADESATCSFERDATGHCERIAYLRRPCLKSVGSVLAAAIRPATPPMFQFFSLSFATNTGQQSVVRAASGRNGAIAGAPPRYLEERRFLI